MSRDPTELARLAPAAEVLIHYLDAAFDLMKQCEKLPPAYRTPRFQDATAHARACWDNLLHKRSAEEDEVRRKMREYAEGDSTPAEPVDFGRTGPGSR